MPGKEVMVNIGTNEKPVLVPEEAVETESERGKNYWEMVEVGAIKLSHDVMAQLIAYIATNGSKSN